MTHFCHSEECSDEESCRFFTSRRRFGQKWYGTKESRTEETELGKEKPHQYYVYILTNFTRVTLYTGITNNLVRRLYEHKNHLFKGFSDRYNCTRLVYFEETTDVLAAITREKQIKGWLRSRKIKLIESMNPQWKDLSEEWFPMEGPPPP